MDLLIFLLLVIFFIFITGLCVGSFLNVVILRAFSNESIIFPPSKCPACQKPLRWYHNIPVLSYLFLRGKCSFCDEKISLQYPIVEIVTAFLFVAVFMKFGFSINLIFMLIFSSLFIVFAVTDIKEKVVFDFHTYTLAILGLIYNFFNFGHLYYGVKIINLGQFALQINNSFIQAILGVLAGIIIMEALARFGYLIAGTRAFGEGDTFIAAGLGAVFGLKYLITVLAYSLIIQVVLTIPVFFKKLYCQKDYQTLAAFIAFFAFAFGIKALDNYELLNNLLVFGVLILILCVLGFYTCKRILQGLKNPENITYLPFGPAMIAGAFFVMFLL
ncbi:MAG TPA: prepilin peptidase [Candidatus Gastranaerophilaceae bacterium]|nr:prepilin peptidase [Candidatus Gastranaerophilaceae bacterium]HPT41116.1 prepilin peptidase [Candidatus Gastranaerophilaceae bacterium]